jgi:hypothetical protein
VGTRRVRFASACGVAFAMLALAGCSSSTPEAPQIEGKTPADYRDEMDKKISRPLGDPPPKGKKGADGGRR